ncbi:NEDD8-activating enzyme E1 regulatory subunit [Rhodotorula diobovata]|uniref:NEDD8-activating enzyme E1 regulatory subunit n=1 Tax=Rhodotorula diobovata TaxID=5288 RepID=A0A5C5G4D9_9BASI|nr:NEDD8-activating enzyme E1 regulatory subunit [Rhodotorula diobovata]
MSVEDALPPQMQDAVPVPASVDRPDAHTQRFDRQLRLWAKTGQHALEHAHVLVVGANATASSSLKNLVLPNVGQFTILDPATVTEADLGANFFLDPTSLGKPRAQEVVRFLLELNSDVKGHSLVQPLSAQLDLSPYSLVLAVDVESRTDLLALSDAAWDKGIPLIKVETAGFYGALRTQVKELTVVETHPESIVDLRLSHPFPALVAHAATYNYATMDSEQHTHVPAVVILVKALEEWKAAHDGRTPTGSAERKDFMDGVVKQKRHADEDNFDEAVTLFRRAGTRPGIPSEIQALFDDPACENITAATPTFWLLLHAVRSFVSHPSNPSRLLPLSGALPDMKASSQGYVALQTLYKTKAREDLALVRRLLGETLDAAGVPRAAVSDDEVETFVRHAAWLKVVRGRSLRMEEDECRLKGQVGALLSAASFQQPPDASLYIYTALRAASLFSAAHHRAPDVPDADALTELAEGLVGAWSEGEDLAGVGIEDGAWREALGKVCGEVARAPPGTTLPQTSALVGGLVAQEAIKLITRQYGPLEGTCVWDGIRSGAGVLSP